MLKGYNGNILRIDLTTGEISQEHPNGDTLRKYIDGVGLAAKILWKETTEQTKPLSPGSPLVFMTGPLTGTTVPSSSHSASLDWRDVLVCRPVAAARPG